MGTPITESQKLLPLAGLLGAGTGRTLHDSLSLVLEVARQASSLHRIGKFHGAIGIAEVAIDPEGRPHLAPPAARRSFGREYSDPESCPPELIGEELLVVPTEIEAARQALQAAGRAIDPRQIDLYQLGALLHRLLTGASILQYMYSAKGKTAVPEAARPILERALGYDPARRFDDTRQLIDSLEDAIRGASRVDTAAGAVRSAGTLSAGARAGPGPSIEDPLPFEHLGPYRILARVGSGGMGDVYRGYEEKLERPVAVKVLPQELARHAVFVRRFYDEAAAAAKVSHPNVVPIYFVGEDQGRHFFAMQFIEGQSLAARLAERGRLSLEESLDVASQCLAGLQAAHAMGLVHRDIKPGNLLIEARTGRVVLVDFGLVRRLDAGQVTVPGTVLGTLDFISPEQARGLPADARADLYAVGVLLYRMLSGRMPFVAETSTGMLFQHVYEPPPPVEQVAPEVPPRLAGIVARLMAKDPADRYPSCAEVLADLAALRGPKSADGDPRDRRAWLRVTLGSGLVLAAAAALAYRTRRRTAVPVSPIESSPPVEPMPRGQWLDLLSGLDLDRDRVHGPWECDGSTLQSGVGTWSRVMLPVSIAGDYDLRVEFTRRSEERAQGNVEVFLPVGMDACSLSLSGSCQVPGYTGRVHGLSRINGKGCGENSPQNNPTARIPGTLEDGRRYTVLAEVRTQGDRATIRATLDGQPLVEWSGRQAELDLHPDWRLFEPRRPGLGSGWNPVLFHAVRLRMISGWAWAAEAVDSRRPAAPVRPGADGTLLLGPRTVEIHGRFLAEGSPGVLGTWTDTADWLSWRFWAGTETIYEVEIRYACHEASQGSVCEAVIVGPQRDEVLLAHWTVEGTGVYWDTPRTLSLGVWKSDSSGPYLLSLKPVRKPGQAVMAFHWIRLMPTKGASG